MTQHIRNEGDQLATLVSDALICASDAAKYIDICLTQELLPPAQKRHAGELLRDIRCRLIFGDRSAEDFQGFADSLSKLIDEEPRIIHVADPYAFDGVREETYVHEGQYELRTMRTSVLQLARRIEAVEHRIAAETILVELREAAAIEADQ